MDDSTEGIKEEVGYRDSPLLTMTAPLRAVGRRAFRLLRMKDLHNLEDKGPPQS